MRENLAARPRDLLFLFHRFSSLQIFHIYSSSRCPRVSYPSTLHVTPRRMAAGQLTAHAAQRPSHLRSLLPTEEVGNFVVVLNSNRVSFPRREASRHSKSLIRREHWGTNEQISNYYCSIYLISSSAAAAASIRQKPPMWSRLPGQVDSYRDNSSEALFFFFSFLDMSNS